MSVAAPDNPYLGVGLYSVPEAARYLQVPSRRLASWAEGYGFQADGGPRHAPPVLRRRDEELIRDRILTFADLMELRLIAAFREHGLSLQYIRAVADYAAKTLDSDHPFALQQFHTDGRRIFAEWQAIAGRQRVQNPFLVEGPSEQLVLDDIARPFFRVLDYEAGEVARFWPCGRDAGIVLDPRYNYGKPIIRRGGVPTRPLYLMVQGGTAPEEVARWYEVEPEAVLQAVEYERSLAAA